MDNSKNVKDILIPVNCFVTDVETTTEPNAFEIGKFEWLL